MKDIAILTKFYKNYNYGGVLQGYALQKTLNSLGYSADLIAYDPFKNINPVYPNKIKQASQYGLFDATTKIIEKSIAKNKFFIKNVLDVRIFKFQEFTKEINSDTEYYDDDTIWRLNHKYKAFISGSDQVWNPNAISNLYLQSFSCEPQRKISYAASIGRQNLSEYEAEKMIPAIRDFGFISVREKTAKDLLSSYIDAPIEVLPDPTLLLGKNIWDEIAAPRMISEKYVLVYFFSDSSEIRKKINSWCLNHSLKLLFIPYPKQEFNLYDQKGPGQKIIDVGPKEFISLIKNSELIITDSFHGAVFSLIYQVPFLVFERNKNGHVSMNSRLYDLLDMFGESNRLIHPNQLDIIESVKAPNAERISKIIAEGREKAIAFLNKSIQTAISTYDFNKSQRCVAGGENECCGCSVCAVVCPRHCIQMDRNQNGFSVPKVDKRFCIECGMCRKVCPMLISPERNEPKNYFAAYSKTTLHNSASGGISYVISRKIISSGGIVYGAVYDDDLHVKMEKVDDLENLIKLQGSKYVQAGITNILAQLLTDLKDGRKVLFTGTPCQIAGVKKIFQNASYSGTLYTIEIICHGVTSPKMFSDYIKLIEKKYQSKVTKYIFRSREKDTDRDFNVKISFENGTSIINSGFKDPYYKLYLNSCWFRESCYVCPYSTKERCADLTIGDFWNDESLPYSFTGNQRISIVSINTDAGALLFDSVKEDLNILESDWKTISKGNINLSRPAHRNAGHVGYGYFGTELFTSTEIYDHKRFLFNQLPRGIRRTVKRVLYK